MAERTDNLNYDELLSAYIDGELTEAERAQVEERLETDAAAREWVAQMRGLSDKLRSLPRHRLPESIGPDVLGQIRPAKNTRRAYEPSIKRRILWPALAIAAALMLILIYGDEMADVEVAKVPGRAEEPRAEAFRERTIPSLEAPAPATVSVAESAAEPPPQRRLLAADESTEHGGAAAESAPAVERGQPATLERALDSLAGQNGELGVVHLTLADFRLGAERFDQLLVSNGVQVIDGAASPESAVSGELAAGSAPGTAAPAASVMSTRSAASPAASGAMGGASTQPLADQPFSSETGQPEMILVEAPPEQIEQILFTCQNDTEAIEAVSIDPTASGTNRTPERQRLLEYQQYSRVAKPTEPKDFGVTPAQQGVISVLNSVPSQQAVPASDALLGQGWATKLRIERTPPDLEQVQELVNERRNQAYNYSQSQSNAALSKKQMDKDAQPMRVLFLLHPSANAAQE